MKLIDQRKAIQKRLEWAQRAGKNLRVRAMNYGGLWYSKSYPRWFDCMKKAENATIRWREKLADITARVLAGEDIEALKSLLKAYLSHPSSDGSNDRPHLRKELEAWL